MKYPVKLLSVSSLVVLFFVIQGGCLQAEDAKQFEAKAHGMTFSLTLPSNWEDVTEKTKAYENELQIERDSERLFACTAITAGQDNDDIFTVNMHPADPASTSLDIEKFENEHMNYLLAAEQFGTLKRAKVMLLGKPAHAVFVDYVAGLPEERILVMAIVNTEPLNNRHFLVYLTYYAKSSIFGKSIQDVASSLKLKE